MKKLINVTFLIYFAFFVMINLFGLLLIFRVLPKRVRTIESVVPNVVKKDYETAAREIILAGLNVHRDLEIESSPVDLLTRRPIFSEGVVMEQEPPAGMKVKPRKPVRLIVSKGSETNRVPNVFGKQLYRAEQNLIENGFRIGHIATVYADKYPIENVVIAQSPMANSTHTRHGVIDLLLSLGVRPKAFEMPDLTGKPIETVRAILRQEGIKIGAIEYISHSKIGSGKIVEHAPAVGEIVSVGQRIDLKVSGSKRIETPSNFIEIRHKVTDDRIATKRVQIYVEDDRGEIRIVDANYAAGATIRKPYKTIGTAWLIIYENEILVKREKIQ